MLFGYDKSISQQQTTQDTTKCPVSRHRKKSLKFNNNKEDGSYQMCMFITS